MQKRIIILFSILMIFITNSTFALSANEKATQDVINGWFAAMKAKDIKKAASYLSPDFLSIHTDRIVRNKQQEIILIQNLDMQDYKLSNFKFSNSGNVMVVTYLNQGSEKIDDKNINTEPAGRMAVLQKTGKRWLILAYANLDQIG